MIRRPPRSPLFPYTPLSRSIGKRHPAVLRPGNINISGKIGRAFINGALLRLLLGKGALVTRENEPYPQPSLDRKSTRLNSSHLVISYAVFCLKKKKLYLQ